MSKQRDFDPPEKPLEKIREIGNEARISVKADQQKSEVHNIFDYCLAITYDFLCL